MAVRYYLSTLSGDGIAPATAFRSIASSLVSAVWSLVDGRSDATNVAGAVLAFADVTQAQHTTLIGNGGVTYIPFENAGGTVLTLANTVSQISTANRTSITNFLEAKGIPTDDFVGTDTIAKCLRRVVKRFSLRQLLGGNDYTQGLDTLVSAMPANQRTAIGSRLAALSFVVSGIQGTDTIRAAIRKLISQNVPYMQTLWDSLT